MNRLIRIVCGLFVAVLLVHAAGVLLRAGFDNTLTELVRAWASSLSLGLRDLFAIGDDRLRLAAGDGAAALLWWTAGYVLTTVAARLSVPGIWQTARRG